MTLSKLLLNKMTPNLKINIGYNIIYPKVCFPKYDFLFQWQKQKESWLSIVVLL